MNNDLVSIITPSYNCAKYLPDCIHSVLAQTYPYWELLIVDDCSTDDTEALVKSYEDNRIFYYRNDVNQGAAYSRNLALREARGRWIAFLDSDDMWMPQKLEHQISFMEKNGYSFSCTGRRMCREDGTLTDIYVTSPKHITGFIMRHYSVCSLRSLCKPSARLWHHAE
jgi:glycosyltransferase involved in cell wall biosynthesis